MTSTLAIEAACDLRAFGFNPLPSHPEKGHPIFPYTKARDHGLSEESFRRLCLSGSTNVQVACGVAWGLVVLDVDGPEGMEMLDDLTRFRPLPVTPLVITPRKGRQYWFKVPVGVSRVPNVDLWKGDGHNGLEILGCGKLAKCPPSYKVIDGECVPYRWAEGRSLSDVATAELPAWLMAYALRGEQEAKVRRHNAAVPIRSCPATVTRVDGSYDLMDVQAALSDHDRIELAGRWGLRFASGGVNAAGWMPCHSYSREDRNPSARFAPHNGWYIDWGRHDSLSFFRLAVALGAYPDVCTAINQVGSRYLARRAS